MFISMTGSMYRSPENYRKLEIFLESFLMRPSDSDGELGSSMMRCQKKLSSDVVLAI